MSERTMETRVTTDADLLMAHWLSGHEESALAEMRGADDATALRFLERLAAHQRCPKPGDHDAILATPEPGGEGEATSHSTHSNECKKQEVPSPAASEDHTIRCAHCHGIACPVEGCTIPGHEHSVELIDTRWACSEACYDALLTTPAASEDVREVDELAALRQRLADYVAFWDEKPGFAAYAGPLTISSDEARTLLALLRTPTAPVGEDVRGRVADEIERGILAALDEDDGESEAANIARLVTQRLDVLAALRTPAAPVGEDVQRDLQERVEAIIRDGVQYRAKADGAHLYEPSVVATADRIIALLRTPRGEGEADIEMLAERVHQAYLDTCARLGWPVKPENAAPYDELSEDSKELDRASVRAVLAALRSEAEGSEVTDVKERSRYAFAALAPLAAQGRLPSPADQDVLDALDAVMDMDDDEWMNGGYERYAPRTARRGEGGE